METLNGYLKQYWAFGDEVDLEQMRKVYSDLKDAENFTYLKSWYDK